MDAMWVVKLYNYSVYYMNLHPKKMLFPTLLKVFKSRGVVFLSLYLCGNINDTTSQIMKFSCVFHQNFSKSDLWGRRYVDAKSRPGGSKVSETALFWVPPHMWKRGRRNHPSKFPWKNNDRFQDFMSLRKFQLKRDPGLDLCSRLHKTRHQRLKEGR